jgi:hypothetical protein
MNTNCFQAFYHTSPSLFSFIYVGKRKILRGQAQVGFAMISAMLVLMILTSYCFGFSAYWFAWKFLPGAGGIRGMTRIMCFTLPLGIHFWGGFEFFFLEPNPHRDRLEDMLYRVS